MVDVATPASRKSDPHTSSEAEKVITQSGERARQQRVVETLVSMFPELTSAELAAWAHYYAEDVAEKVYGREPTESDIDSVCLNRWQIARRLPECEVAKTVTRWGSRPCKTNNRQALIWRPVQ